VRGRTYFACVDPLFLRGRHVHVIVTNVANLEPKEVEGKFAVGEENYSVIDEAKDTRRMQSSTDALSFDVSSSAVARIWSSV
jgi:hypothetical protein